MKIMLNIYIPETSASDADAHLSASLILAWPEGRLVPRRGEFVHLDDVVLEVTQVAHNLHDGGSGQEMTLDAVQEEPVGADIWSEFAEEWARGSSYALPGIVLSVEKH